ncbi:MAG: insulinase family protein [Lentimicrobiaceae bacterium]|jgi:zinc protease|nr:insulinase family protein [Lentimicrobiaceae bacterium]
MKRLLLSLVAFAILSVTGFAQTALPIDPNVRYGVLDNGLTYYIRHNNLPEKRAEFYIAQKVGSILEEENQRGLAHFLEHMAFNGTENFPGKTMLDYLERNGIKFGQNINAGTGIEQTVYMITNVPTTNKGLVDSCLLVLHDWSSFISLEEAEIDKERGVILEELRSRNNAQQRMWEVMLPEMYPNSPYGNRLPGGLPEVVASFEYQVLRDYYAKWYRPDLQGIIVVGDIDVDEIEAKIKTMFADIPAPVNPAERTKFEVADNADPIVSICADPEATNYQLLLFYKHNPFPEEVKGTMEYVMIDYVLNIISEMYNNRMEELRQKSQPPFVYGYGYYGDFYVSQTKDAWTGAAVAKDATGIDEALRAIVHENNRMRQHGFTNSEYERAKADFLQRIESEYNDRNTQKHGKYVRECLNHFMENDPMPGIEYLYNTYSQMIIPALPLEIVNQMASQFVTDNNMVIALAAPLKEGEKLPTKEELLAIVLDANNDPVEPYLETVSDEPLMATIPKAGKVKKEVLLPEFEAIEWELSNGARVVYKPTKFKEDEIRMSAYSFGGTSVLKQDNIETIKNIESLITIGGVGNFSAVDLPKVLAGKKASVTPYINVLAEGLRGSSSPKDLETLMQLIHLYFTQARSDEEAFQSYLTRTKAILENMEANPMITLQDSLIDVMYNNHPLAVRTKVEDLEKIDYKLAMDIYKNRFADPNNFTFFFVGNIDPDQLKTLSEQYIGSLKPTKRKESWKDNGLAIVKGDRSSRYEKKMETPKTTVFMAYNGDMEYSLENETYMEVLTSILDIVYTEKIRENEGGTYGVSVFGSLTKRPKETFVMQIVFETNDEIYEKLMGIAKDELELIAKEGPSEVNLNKVKEFMLKDFQEEKQENRFWMNALTTYYQDDMNTIDGYEKLINNITADTIKKFAEKIVAGYQKEIVQNPLR